VRLQQAAGGGEAGGGAGGGVEAVPVDRTRVLARLAGEDFGSRVGSVAAAGGDPRGHDRLRRVEPEAEERDAGRLRRRAPAGR
jgi:hypothetical protein